MTGETLLGVRGISAGYGSRDVLFDVDLTVGVGEVVAVIGHNGAGKSTLLKTVLGLVEPRSGVIEFGGVDVTSADTPTRIDAGMAYSPQQHFVFPELSVAKNLTMGTYVLPRRSRSTEPADEVSALFPVLGQRLRQRAGTLSGGQQRMLGLAMAMLSRPRLLVLDELSLGISPRLFDEILEVLTAWSNAHATAVLFVEQHVDRALDIADRAIVLRGGAVVADWTGVELAGAPDRWEWF